MSGFDPVKFQSLFFWIHFYNGAEATFEGSLSLVSILVFLDSLLQLFEEVIMRVEGVVFQSLFFWIHFYNRR